MSHIGKVYQETKLDLIGMYLTGWEVSFPKPEPFHGVWVPSSVVEYIERHPPQITGSLSPTSGSFGNDFLLVKPPKTTAEILAVAVLKGEPCGRELIDCLIEEGVVDPNAEAIKQAKLESLKEVNDLVHQLDAMSYYDDKVGDAFYQIGQKIGVMIDAITRDSVA